MINSLYSAAYKVGYAIGSKDQGFFKKPEYKTILNEATSNENWNISNSKLQVLADHTYNWEDYNVIMKHLWSKIQSKPKEWRRIFKALSAMDYLVKNGAPRVVQDIKDDLYKIRTMQDFNFSENGTDRGQGVRDKSKELCELLSDPAMLQQEREFARQTRDKLQGMSTQGGSATGPPTTGGQFGGSAGPASGKYGGFGSEDIQRMGYNQENKFNAPYDPYTKGQSAPSQPAYVPGQIEEPKKPAAPTKKSSKKNKEESSDYDSEDNSSGYDSEDSEEERRRKRRKQRRAKRRQAAKEKVDDGKATKPESKPAGLGKPTESSRVIGGVTVQGAGVSVAPTQPPVQQQHPQPVSNPQQDLMDLLSGPSQPAAPQQQPAQQPNAFDFMNQSAPQQQQQTQPTAGQQAPGLFGGLNVAQPQQQQQPQNLFQGMNTAAPQQQPPPQQQPQQNAFPFMGQQSQQQAQPAQQQQPNLFGGLNLQQNSSTQPPVQATQVNPGSAFDPFSFGSAPAQPTPPVQPQQPQQQQPPVQQQAAPQKPKDPYGGLFDLSGVKQDQKSIDEVKQQQQQQQAPTLLQSSNSDTLESLWGNTANNQQFGGFSQGQGNQQNNKPAASGFKPAPFQPQPSGFNQGAPGGFQPQMGMPFAQQQQPPMFNPNAQVPNMGQMTGGMGQQVPGQQPQQQQPMTGMPQFAPPQFFNGQQQQPNIFR